MTHPPARSPKNLLEESSSIATEEASTPARMDRMTRTPTASTGHRARPGSRREDIAAAAIELFLARGVAATRVEDILAAAGVSVGSFYHHFGDKLSLAATVYLEHLQRFQG